MHAENKPNTPSEKACQLVRSSAVSDRSEVVAQSHDRTGQPRVGKVQELDIEHAQLGTLLDRQREQILAD